MAWPPPYPYSPRPFNASQVDEPQYSSPRLHHPYSWPSQSYERPPTRQAQYERPRPPSRQQVSDRLPSRLQPVRPSSRQQNHERPPSRQETFSRPASRAQVYDRAPSRQQTNDRPPSRQQVHDRPPSRQQVHDRPPSRQQTYDRPPSRQQPEQPRPRRYSERNDRPQTASEVARRTFLRNIADTTIAAINKGIPGVDVTSTQRNTRLYREDGPELKHWNGQLQTMFTGASKAVEINILPFSTLKGARFFHELDPKKKVGVLNFASATKPGGGFLSGARAQEESIARSSTLYVSLTTDAARPFYAIHDKDDKKGYYTHTMIYSPDVHLFRDDDGTPLPPIKVDVLTSPAVNAGQVRQLSRRTRAQIETNIQEVMRERMGRILALFEKKRARALVLGSFGTGVFQNDVRAMAKIWHDLLLAPGARFAHSFEHVVFAIPDDGTLKQFGSGFAPDAKQDVRSGL